MKKMNLATKMMMFFLLVGIIPFITISIISLVKSSNALKNQAYGQLEGMRGVKKSQINRFFEEREGNLGVLLETVKSLQLEAESKLESIQNNKKTAVEILINQWFSDIQAQRTTDVVTEGMNEYKQYLLTNLKTSPYKKHISTIDNFIRISGYYDYFVIDLDGHIVYTHAKESDYNTNILTGQYKDSGLARAVKAAIEKRKPVIEDFSPYSPSDGESAAFVAAPILANKEMTGIVALQVSLKKTQKIIEERTGLGETGESYLIGKKHNTISFRSNMLTMGDGKFKVGYDVTNIIPEYVKDALAGQVGTDLFTDTSGNLVLVSYAPLKTNGLEWAIITKINLDEVIVPQIKGEEKDFYTKYIEKYGYYDLFLIHPKGKVFYTVTKEADYQTNMVNGKYADSGLGKLVRKVINTKEYGVGDFEPYAPSNNEPAAFIAQPIVNGGAVELIVALQLSLDAINGVMQQRDGMGSTGETYLVGPDKLMRSDSFLAPTSHSVKASFSDPSTGKVDTEASQLALSGREGSKIIIDYNGHPVLSAFTPLKIGDMTWALIAEIDKAEAFAAVKSLKLYIGIIALVAIAVIVVVAFFLSRSITSPIIKGVRMANEMAQGDLTQQLDIRQQDEIGTLAEALNTMSKNLRQMFNDIASGTQTLTASSTELSAISDQITSNSDQTADKSNNVSAAAEEMATSMNSVAAATEQTTTNIQMIVSAAEEMSSTINEIASNTAKGSETTAAAVKEAEQVSMKVDQLGKAASEINKVTDTIADISEQTNLLALNATIEAARAGDAGKGFAVVAGEIKDLAKQTAEATKEISSQIAGVQSTTQESVESIESIVGVINEINTVVTSVATAIEEQSTTTQEISTNVSQAAMGLNEVNASVNQTSAVVGEVTRDITQVSQATEEMKTGSRQVNISAAELYKLAENLNELVSRFKV